MGIECAVNMTNQNDNTSGIKTAANRIRAWRSAKQNLTKRAEELNRRSVILQNSHPATSRALKERADTLTREATKMTKSDRKGRTMEQIRRETALAKLALMNDKG